MPDEIAIALRLITEHHADQTDKSGKPYINHLLSVAANVSPPARPAALLHDIIEDTDVTAEDLLAAGLSRVTVETVVYLSHIPGVKYADYTESLVAAPGVPGRRAREIKVADIEHNLSPERRYPGDSSIRGRYEKAHARLKEVVPADEAQRCSTFRRGATDLHTGLKTIIEIEFLPEGRLITATLGSMKEDVEHTVQLFTAAATEDCELDIAVAERVSNYIVRFHPDYPVPDLRAQPVSA